MNKLFLIAIFLLGFVSNFISQYQTFTPDSVKYMKEAEDYLGYVNKSDAKDFMKEFELVWFGGKFSAAQRAIVYTTSNIMSQKKLKPYPDFKNYLSAVMNFVGSGKSNEDFNIWHETVTKVMDGRNNKKISEYLETCSNLFESNTIFKSSSTTWQASNNKYKFIFDKEPIIEFDEMDLKCYSKNDSSVLYKTKGTYYPMTSIWKGEGGKLTWERAELPKDQVFADVQKYEVSMKSAGFKADSVSFSSRYFEKPIIGELTEKVLSNRGADRVSYPSFESYDKRLEIKNIFENVDYEGGFTIQGQNLLGAGTFDELAKLTFYREKKEFFIAESLIFTINDKDISSQRAKIKFIIESDSVYHPGVSFNYKNSDQKITLVRSNEGISQSPYYNTYHKLDMYFEALYWKVGDPVMEFGPLYGSTDTTAYFSSSDYFDINVYDRLTGTGNNPLVLIKNHSIKVGSEDLEVVGLATALRRTVEAVEPLLFQLTAMGFISYDSERKMVHIKQKLYNYIDSKKKKRDFDVIVINSASQENATLSLLSNDLTIRGVKGLMLGSAQKTKIYPRGNKITVKKNRDMVFGGIINAGKTEFFGSQFTFNYDEFKLDLVECDSMRIRVENEQAGNGSQIRLLSKIEGVRGEINIDEAGNKSGQDTSVHNYPILHCTKKTYVYYDDNSIQKGAYNRENFKFIIEPFEMDSLDNFSNGGMGFEGEFISAGIFPDFKETLKLQKDNSLGFIRETPKDGYGIYGDKATYDNEIRLSHEGLMGTGVVDFLTSHAVSDQMTFLPDRVKALAQDYTNTRQEEDPTVPLVKGKDVRITYIPKEKVLYAESEDNFIDFFDNKEAQLEGKLALRPEGMTGEGRMYFGKGRMLSYEYTYGTHTIDADTSEFQLLSEDMESLAFRTENVNGHVDFVEREGKFKSNSGESFVEFPDNQYICYMDVFKWQMESDDIEMEAKKTNVTIDSDLDLATSNFYSTHPEQDSLDFRAPKAKFDIKKKKLVCREILYITIADARITPDSGLVVIKKKAKMETLKNASILANYITKYHEIFDATVDITAKRAYTASGYYNYVDEVQNQQKIYFSNIHPDTTYQTTAKGEIDDKAGFRLSPQFEYHGDVEMFASFKELTFTGETRIAHNCQGLERNWMSFTAALDPEDIFIPVESELVDVTGKPIGAGIVMNNDSIGLYGTFLSVKSKKEHPNVMTADGFLHYDKNTKEYQISNKDKLKEKSLPGNYISLNTENCQFEGDGRFSFGTNLGQVELNNVGEMDYDPAQQKLEIKSSIAINFPFTDEALDKMAKHIVEYPDLQPVDLTNSTYEKALRELIGLEKADRVISDLNIHGKVKKFPDELVNSIYLADIRFKWDVDRSAYVSYSDIGIANLGKKQVYKYVRGKVAIYKRRTGDEISIFLQMDENNFYFFNYKRGVMQVYSSNEEFNTVISETKKDKTKFKGTKEVEDYQFILSSKTKAVGFRRSFD